MACVYMHDKLLKKGITYTIGLAADAVIVIWKFTVR